MQKALAASTMAWHLQWQVVCSTPEQKAGSAWLLCSLDGRGRGREGPDGYLPPPPRGRGGASRGRGDMHSDGGRSFSDRGTGVARGGGEFARGVAEIGVEDHPEAAGTRFPDSMLS